MTNNSRLSFTTPSELMNSALNSFSVLSQASSPKTPTSSSSAVNNTGGHVHQKSDLLWATKLDLKEKGYQCLHDFTLLAKEATYATETSEEVIKVAKQFTQVEPSIKNTHQTLLKIKQSMKGIHQCNESILDSFKTLPVLLDSLQIEELAKLTPNSAPSALNQQTQQQQGISVGSSNNQVYSNFHYSLSQLSQAGNGNNFGGNNPNIRE
ncbi:hypothetical protein CONCODRAFT_86574 [Conidiobolus coronatus NRRL 28638]|uniref:BLOC-1-related complex subunit 7 n=1 Tax=Conidiobolus coronatus (strain ATCC 28846 / CBS 209.66 / NRRL 28638) TaxID=796925 RepID=A0A137NZM7_CONC2|nr:hypothetical protein CONCODRAFT_86574 [Conidiobolus coronatus NRRL 28638]|eukprot:KXN68217.1 hypothetical protein CONCODRAFT_86574 [Conidiobolus coronatus NRRL 28638]